MSEQVFAARAPEIVPNRRWALATTVLVAVGFVGLLVCAFNWAPGVMPAVLAIVAGMVGRVAASWTTRQRDVTLTVTNGAIFVDNDLRARLADVGQAGVYPKPDGSSVVRIAWRGYPVELAHRFLDVELRDAESAQAFLRAIGWDSTRQAMRFVQRPPLVARALTWAAAATSGGFALTMAGALVEHVAQARGLDVWLGVALLGLTVSLPSAAIVLALRPHWLEIGADGIVVGRSLAPRFVPIASVADVRVHAPGARARRVDVVLASGEVLAIPLANTEAATGEAGMIRERVLEAKRLASEAPALPPHALRVGAESMPAWVTRLRALLETARVDHRTPALSADALWAIVEHPGSPLDARLAATQALAGDPARRERLHRAAVRVALPQARRALELAAEGDADAYGREAIETAERAQLACSGPSRGRFEAI